MATEVEVEQATGTEEELPASGSETVVEQPTERQGATDATEQEAETDEQKNERVQREAAAKTEKRARGVQKRMDELTRDKYEERKRADELAAQNSRLLEAVLASKGQGTQGVAKGEPQPESFTDYNEYVKALATFHATQASTAVAEKTSKAQRDQAEREAAIRAENSAAVRYAERAQQAAKSLPDFAEVMEDAASVNIPTHVLNMIRRMDDGPVIAYHMVKNPKLASQFFSQPPEMHGILLGQLSATLNGTAKTSNAPPPGRPVLAKPGSGSEPPQDTDAYMKWAEKHMR